MKDWQMIRSLKHLRFGLGGAKVSVPFLHIKQFSEGYVQPRTKKFKHVYPDKSFEWVKVEYQPIDEVYPIVVRELMTEKNLTPEQVAHLEFVLGGDHGKEAFRLCFRVIITTDDGTLHYKDYGGAATIFSKKDSPDILEAAIMDWLTEDLRSIHESKVFLSKTDDGSVECVLLRDEVDMEPTDNSKLISKTVIFNTGDLKWMAMLLGMDGMSRQWCIYCYLRKHEWSVEGHDRGEPRTIENMTEQFEKGLSGSNRRGVNFRPYWDFIPVSNYAVPLLHLMIGIFNDIDEFVLDFIDTLLIDHDPQEKVLRDEYSKIDEVIDALKLEVDTWMKSSPEGRRRANLTKRKNKQDKQIKDGVRVENPLTVEEIAEWQRLEKMRLEMANRRDGKKKEKTNIREKIDAYTLARKNDPTSLHNKLEDYFRMKKLDRGKAFGGKYDGKVARAVMEQPAVVYDEGFKKILKDARRESVSEAQIDTLVADVVHLMQCWNEFFSLLQQAKPTEDERARAPEVAQKAVRAHHKLLKNITPKVHVAEDHAVDQYLRVRPGLMRLLIEHFVEKNHQDGYKIEKQFNHEPSLQRRANFTAAARHAANNGAIQAKVAEVNAPIRSKYKKQKKRKSCAITTSALEPITPSPNKRSMTNPPSDNTQPTT